MGYGLNPVRAGLHLGNIKRYLGLDLLYALVTVQLQELDLIGLGLLDNFLGFLSRVFERLVAINNGAGEAVDLAACLVVSKLQRLVILRQFFGCLRNIAQGAASVMPR